MIVEKIAKTSIIAHPHATMFKQFEHVDCSNIQKWHLKYSADLLINMNQQ